MRTLTSLAGNSQRLDGGAMFGNAPKALWTRWIEPDDDNRIPLACRCLLVRDGDRRILFEAGIGTFFSPKLKERFGVVEPNHVLLDSLRQASLAPEDVDVVVLSHLHFDHAGGLLSGWNGGAEQHLAFPNARFVIGENAWHRAKDPHPRDRASFIPELIALLEASGRLEVASGPSSAVLGEGYTFYESDGHTPGLLATEIEMPDGPVVFTADIIPGAAWLHLPITMGYDRFPEMLIDEKRDLLEGLVAREGRVFFTHDPAIALCEVIKDERGRFAAGAAMAELRQLAR